MRAEDLREGTTRLQNGSLLRVALSPTGENGVLVAFDGGPGEDGEPLHGRASLAIRALAQRCLLDNFLYEPHAQCLCSGKHIARQHIFHRIAPAALLRKTHRRAAEWKYAARHFELAEFGARRRDTHIARQHQFDAEREAETMRGNDHGFCFGAA